MQNSNSTTGAEPSFIQKFADQTVIQLKKGLLSYYILLVAKQPIYTSDIIKQLDNAGLRVVEGTIYPLLSRLQREGLLQHEWQESKQGPPRKYYSLTPLGIAATAQLHQEIISLNSVTNKLEGENHE